MATNRYDNGKIYRLVNSVDNEEYVGSTCGKLSKRLFVHKCHAKEKIGRRVYKHLNEIGWENVEIVLVEEYPCENKMELERRERYWIEELKPSLNMCIPTRSKKEWEAENADRLKEYQAQWRMENAEHLKKEKQRWATENRDKTNEYKEKWAANNVDKVREKNARWYAENKEAINARKRERRAKKKADSEAST